jgi:hypothetical protein
MKVEGGRVKCMRHPIHNRPPSRSTPAHRHPAAASEHTHAGVNGVPDTGAPRRCIGAPCHDAPTSLWRHGIGAQRRCHLLHSQRMYIPALTKRCHGVSRHGMTLGLRRFPTTDTSPHTPAPPSFHGGITTHGCRRGWTHPPRRRAPVCRGAMQ